MRAGLEVDHPETLTDFGNLARGRAALRVTARDEAQVQQCVRLSREAGRRVTIRSRGWSQSGQSIGNETVLLDVSALAGIVSVEQSSVRVRPGTTFRQLLLALAERGHAPAAMPLCLDLSVGGVASAGGFGSTSHRYGFVASTVQGARLIDELAELHELSGQDARLAAALGGVGAAGVMTEIELATRPLLPRVRTRIHRFDSASELLAVQRRLRDSFTHLEAWCSSSFAGIVPHSQGGQRALLRPEFFLQVAQECSPDDDPACSGSEVPGELMYAGEQSTLEFLQRYDLRFRAMQATGEWDAAHPWFECLLPYEGCGELVSEILRMLPPFFGEGHRLSLLAPDAWTAGVAVPRTDLVVAFGILPTSVPQAFLEPALGVLRAVHDRCLGFGGKRYLSGWQFEDAASGWTTHATGLPEQVLEHRARGSTTFSSILLERMS